MGILSRGGGGNHQGAEGGAGYEQAFHAGQVRSQIAGGGTITAGSRAVTTKVSDTLTRWKNRNPFHAHVLLNLVKVRSARRR